MRKILILFFLLFLFVHFIINTNNYDKEVDIRLKREPIIVEKLPLADDNWKKHFKSEPSKGEWQKYLIDL